jgi:hypothetical protein
MMIIGCDYHPAFQQIAFVDTDTGAAAFPAGGSGASDGAQPSAMAE